MAVGDWKDPNTKNSRVVTAIICICCYMCAVNHSKSHSLSFPFVMFNISHDSRQVSSLSHSVTVFLTHLPTLRSPHKHRPTDPRASRYIWPKT